MAKFFPTLETVDKLKEAPIPGSIRRIPIYKASSAKRAKLKESLDHLKLVLDPFSDGRRPETAIETE